MVGQTYSVACACASGRTLKNCLRNLKLKASKEGGRYFVQISNCEKEVFKWIEFVVMKNLPVSIVDCPYTRDITRLKKVSAQTLRCHILELLSVVKETIQAELPPKFIIVFDGWTEGFHH